MGKIHHRGEEMMLILKFVALYTIASCAFGLFIAPIFGRLVHAKRRAR
jgi:hypothetical protein